MTQTHLKKEDVSVSHVSDIEVKISKILSSVYKTTDWRDL